MKAICLMKEDKSKRRTNKSSVSSDRRSSEDRRKVDINEIKKDKNKRSYIVASFLFYINSSITPVFSYIDCDSDFSISSTK